LTHGPGDRSDVLIVGGGIVGLATAYRLLEARPDLRLTLVEKEAELATHQTGHNSGVLHAGLYYAPGSRKAELCREGKADLEAFATAHDIPFERCGKLVVAVDRSEVPRLADLHRRAEANGVPALEDVDADRMREIEPHVAGLRGLWSPSTGVIDFRRVALALAEEVLARGGIIETDWPVRAIDARGTEVVVRRADGDARIASVAIVCGGLQADRLARLTGEDQDPVIIPFRGDYYTLSEAARPLVRGLIYPVPDPRLPFLGVHLTRRVDGEVWAGPNAVLAFAREGYRRRDLRPGDLAGTLRHPGFRRLARRYWRTGLVELWRDWWKPAFVAELRRYVPEIRAEDLRFGPSGVRAQALSADGNLLDDFVLGGRGRVVHVRNAPSPAATSSLTIGRRLAGMAVERLACIG
jgi:L-2-hydroxyglutarate oxidase LhgO